MDESFFEDMEAVDIQRTSNSYSIRELVGVARPESSDAVLRPELSRTESYPARR